MQKYRLQLGQTGHRIGSIDTRTGITLDLIDAIVSKSLKYGTWSMHKHFLT